MARTRKPPATVALHAAATGAAIAWQSLDPTRFARRVFAPERVRLAEAWDAVEGLDEPAEAWEALAARGLIPMDWVGDARRQIVGDGRCVVCDCGGLVTGHAHDCERAAAPPTVAAAVTLASDTDGVATAETMAREAHRRMSSDDEPARLVWRVVPGPAPARQFSGRPGRVLRKHPDELTYEMSRRVLNAVGDELAQRLGAPKRTWVGAAYEYFRAAGPAEELAAQVAHDVREDMIRAMAWDRAAREKRPNPFHPVWEIWQLGYKLETFDEEMVVLTAVEAPRAEH